MAIPGISAEIGAMISHALEANFQHYLDQAASTAAATSPPPSSAPTSSSSVSELQSEINQLINQETIAEARQDLVAEHQPVPKNLTVSQAQQIINDFPQFEVQQQAISSVTTTANGP